MNAKKDALLECIRTHDDTAWNVCTAVWEFILSQKPEEGKIYFFIFLSQIFIEDLDVENEDIFFSSDTLSQIGEDIDRLVNRIIVNLVRQRLSEESFYEHLWNKISDDTLIPDQKAQVAFLICLWIDPRIPYYQVGDGCSMENAEFTRIRNEVWPVIKKADFILSIPFAQRTQRASLIMELADKLKDERERAVFWACVITHLSENTIQFEKSDA